MAHVHVESGLALRELSVIEAGRRKGAQGRIDRVAQRQGEGIVGERARNVVIQPEARGAFVSDSPEELLRRAVEAWSKSRRIDGGEVEGSAVLDPATRRAPRIQRVCRTGVRI